ncbi:hypothetical protein GUITHDRAFT_76537, partial [Guillardia theta CCMP2712]
TAQHSTAQHSTAQHSTAQHSTAQHSRRGKARQGREGGKEDTREEERRENGMKASEWEERDSTANRKKSKFHLLLRVVLTLFHSKPSSFYALLLPFALSSPSTFSLASPSFSHKPLTSTRV